jgi:hypothetical protein
LASNTMFYDRSLLAKATLLNLKEREELAYYRVYRWLLSHARIVEGRDNIGVPARDARMVLSQFGPRI